MQSKPKEEAKKPTGMKQATLSSMFAAAPINIAHGLLESFRHSYTSKASYVGNLEEASVCMHSVPLLFLKISNETEEMSI